DSNLSAAGYAKLGVVELGNVWEQRTGGVPPGPRTYASAAWTGSEMLIWGGLAYGAGFKDGGRYKPTAKLWAVIATNGAPAERYGHTAVWTGTEMIVWGGYNAADFSAYGDGGRYNPATGNWTLLNGASASVPGPRVGHTAVWTGGEMIIWGGFGGTRLN